MPTDNMKFSDTLKCAVGAVDNLTSDEPVAYELTMENPTIRSIQPDRYELIKDLVKWAVIHDKDVLLSEHETTFTVSISSSQESEVE